MRRFLLLSASISALVFGFGAAASAQMKPIVDESKPVVEKKVEEVVKKAEEKVSEVAQDVKAEVKEAVEAVGEKAEAAKEEAGEAAKAVEQKVEPVTEAVKEEVKEVAKAVEEKAEETKAVVTENAEDAKEGDEAATPAKTPVLPNFGEQPAPDAKAGDAAPEPAATNAESPPEEAPKVLLSDVLGKDGDFDTLLELVKLAGLDAVLADTATPHTIFAPSDDAFSDMESKLLDDLRKPENKDKLVDFLSYHIVNGKITRAALDNNSSEVMTTTLKRLRVVGDKGKLSVNGIAVDETDAETDNGVVFKIGKVITSEAERVTVAPVGAPVQNQTDAVATGGGMPDTSRLAPADGVDFVPAPSQTPPVTPVEGEFKPETAPKKAWYKFW